MPKKHRIANRRCSSEFWGVALALVVAGQLTLACEDAKPIEIDRSKAGSGGQAGDGSGAEGGDAPNPSGGTNMTPQGGAGEPEPCVHGERGCAEGNHPQECNARGEWVLDENPCGGDTKVCTGQGVCVPYRLLNAGIDSFGVRLAEGQIVLKEQTLSAAPRSCGDVKGQEICVTGGVR